MSLNIGDRLAHYQVVAAIGVGGMGEVYQARDTKLERDVAIKILPADVARDQERLSRFKREAKLLAALNHPGVATLYGLEEWGSSRARPWRRVLRAGRCRPKRRFRCSDGSRMHSTPPMKRVSSIVT